MGVLVVEDWKKRVVIAHCRICHESEFESSKSLEAPCSCSGTVKFAHRDCIQRWCDEKGNTVCEICLQKYEPGYIVAPAKESLLIDEAVTIRDRLEVPRREHDIENQESMEAEGTAVEIETMYFECNSAAVTRICRLLAFIATFILLVRHVFLLFRSEASQDYPFTFVTLLVVKIGGIVVPMYMLIRTITAIQRSIQKSARLQHYFYDSESNHSPSNSYA